MRPRTPWPEAPQPMKEKPIWVVSLIDTFSLLLCFFILIFSMGTPDTQRFRDIAHSLAKQIPVSGTRPLAPPAPPASEAPTVPVEYALNLDYATSLIEGRVERMPALRGLRIKRRSDRLSLVPPTDVAFVENATEMNPGVEPMLVDVGDLLAHVPNRLEVRAGVGATASWELALERAAVVVRALRRGGYANDPVVVAGVEGEAIELSLLATKAETR